MDRTAAFCPLGPRLSKVLWSSWVEAWAPGGLNPACQALNGLCAYLIRIGSSRWWWVRRCGGLLTWPRPSRSGGRSPRMTGWFGCSTRLYLTCLWAFCAMLLCSQLCNFLVGGQILWLHSRQLMWNVCSCLVDSEQLFSKRKAQMAFLVVNCTCLACLSCLPYLDITLIMCTLSSCFQTCRTRSLVTCALLPSSVFVDFKIMCHLSFRLMESNGALCRFCTAYEWPLQISICMLDGPLIARVLLLTGVLLLCSKWIKISFMICWFDTCLFVLVYCMYAVMFLWT